ncbi:MULTISPECIES: Rok-like winged helix domain-containing protein [Bacillus]|uniref:Repressor rok n=1 Tax=Bacillus sonorensis TaxID=119858 RepID=A0ABN5AMM8_9BACI|nr:MULTISPECIES: transcriptional repressor Rok [Bacillus]ASB89422.1 Repressor rok [Bacillus sonorensis]MEC0338266.1 transcriptional repressor Rok [Bacillus sonorensis]MEC0425123.1 transcriptional repressor Rok [Bacillus sonorensis]MEC0460677.1 transcriptional repressor Rok [Bacillus sonorensis]MEC0526332.1 transcriptional repressor Rok [Bacillus sonorensis]
MFNEREALRLRLEQLKDAEIKIMRELRTERNRIYVKLHELDSQGDSSVTNKKSLIELVSETAKALENNKSNEISSNDSTPKPRRKPKPGTKAYKHREAALKVLQEHKGEIRSYELQKEIEKETGIPINNMTTFMQGLMKFYPEVEKTYRGRYVLRKSKMNAMNESPSD